MGQYVLEFEKRPSDIGALWQAFQSRNSRFTSVEDIARISAVRRDFEIDRRHLEAFNEICGIEPTASLHVLYPFTLAYPYLMRILCRHEMPFSQFRILNTRCAISLLRPVKASEKMDIVCYNSDARMIKKGLEFDFKSDLVVDGETVWTNTATYFFPCKLEGSSSMAEAQRLEPLEGQLNSQEWFLPARDRVRFGRVSGDTNGIHVSSAYARMLGFKRDFSQPIRVVAPCVSRLQGYSADQPADLEFHLKGPVYYERTLTMKSRSEGNSHRFDLYCSENDRPCISGLLVERRL